MSAKAVPESRTRPSGPRGIVEGAGWWSAYAALLVSIPIADYLFVRGDVRSFPLVGKPFTAAVAIGLAAGAVTAVWHAARRIESLALKLFVALILSFVAVVAGVAASSTSLADPRVNFVIQKPRFVMLTAMLDRGDFRDTRGYYGDLLPPHLASLSITGQVSGRVCQDQRLYFIPQWVGIPDDAGGYLYIPGTLDRNRPCMVDLYGRSVDVNDARAIGEGWWWI
ncbi:hypothetical protein ACWIGI_08975 [Nocardia sp. NPDC055321]